MKRILAGLMCLVLCFEGSNVLAYKDFSDVEEYVEITDLFSNLEIMEGFDDGTFRPDSTLTRAEAAAIMVRLLGNNNPVPKGKTSFTDVESTHWAKEYIYHAEERGIINGMGDGSFDPDGLVTYHQFVKMLVCVLGYKPIAEDKGGFNGGGYLYVGSSQVTGFTKGVPGEKDKPITRITAARLIHNALEVEIFEEWAYDVTASGACIDLPDYKTIIEDYLGYEIIKGVIIRADNETIELEITHNYTTGERFKNGQICALKNEIRNGEELKDCTVVACIQKTDTENRIVAATKKED